jgi:cytochrome c oxidase subunit III
MNKESMASPVYQHVASRPIAERQGHAQATRSGIWVGIFAITMSFAAFTSALMVRQGSGDWKHLVLPPIIYLNTTALLFSSVTLERARSRATHGSRSQLRDALPWLTVTLALGLIFVAGQYSVWGQLAGQGLYLATTSNSSFFYVFTVMHVLHLLGGIAALAYLIAKIAPRRAVPRWTLFEGAAIYWHFMGVLWLYLLIVIATRL